MESDIYFCSVIEKSAEVNLSSPLLYQLTDLTTYELHFIFSQIYYFVNLFPGYLAALIWHTNNEAIRFALIENLIDESGGFEKIRNRNYAETHSEILKKFVKKLDGANGQLA